MSSYYCIYLCPQLLRGKKKDCTAAATRLNGVMHSNTSTLLLFIAMILCVCAFVVV